jgi:uncharacterized protein YjiS (DUF1127 family)
MKSALDLGLLRVVRQPRRRSLWAQLSLWWRRARERRELLRMSDRDLRDIALTRIDALREATKPFWRS